MTFCRKNKLLDTSLLSLFKTFMTNDYAEKRKLKKMEECRNVKASN